MAVVSVSNEKRFWQFPRSANRPISPLPALSRADLRSMPDTTAPHTRRRAASHRPSARLPGRT